MNLEFGPMDPRLEQAVTEIHNDEPDAATVEAAAERVWARLAAAQHEGHEHIRGCDAFQALIPEYRAGRLPVARATLLKDHLHECVACRRVYEGRVVAMPAASQTRKPTYTYRWAAAAGVLLAAGLTVWFAMDQYGGRGGRTFVQAVNGTLYEVTADGNLRPLTSGQELPDGGEIRTAKDSDAMIQLRDGSVVELRERSGFSTVATASDMTIRLNRGSIIVQAAKRRTGHLYVATTDCRVAVTGTVFSVVSGVKGSRVSVVEGEVHVAQNNQDHVLHPGDQIATSLAIEPGTVRDDVSWSRNKDKLVQQLDKLRISLQQVPLPALRYSSKLLDRLPADTVVYGSIPNLGPYLTQTQALFGQNLAQSPELRALWNAKGSDIDRVVEKLRTASEYLGDEIVLAGFAGENGQMPGVAFLAETKRDGFAEFLKKELPGVTVETQPGLVAFGPHAEAVARLAPALVTPAGGFVATPFYTRIAEAYRNGAGMMLAADLSQLHNPQVEAQGVRYFLAEQKEVNHEMELRATVGFAGERPGIAGWLAAPASIGSLDYVSPEATLVTGFVVKDPKAIVDQISTVGGNFVARGQAGPANGAELTKQLAATLGGEFSLSFDGPIFPPSWKLICEVYDPVAAQTALQNVVAAFNAQLVANGKKPLRTGTETVEGRTYYMIAGADGNALTEAHYTFADGYLIAGPTRALISKALQTKLAGTSITRSSAFLALEPRDHYANYSALIYENLGKTLAPFAGLLGSFVPQQARGGGRGGPDPLAAISDMKPLLIGAYAEGDTITVAANGNMLAKGMSNMLGGNLMGVIGSAMPMGQMQPARRR
jgi:hypothetical protein